METRAVLSLPFGSLRILPPADWTVGVDLPPGWILAEASRMGEMRVSYVAIDTADGSFVPLPTLGDVPIQG
jgi:hypothetical protein